MFNLLGNQSIFREISSVAARVIDWFDTKHRLTHGNGESMNATNP